MCEGRQSYVPNSEMDFGTNLTTGVLVGKANVAEEDLAGKAPGCGCSAISPRFGIKSGSAPLRLPVYNGLLTEVTPAILHEGYSGSRELKPCVL